MTEGMGIELEEVLAEVRRPGIDALHAESATLRDALRASRDLVEELTTRIEKAERERDEHKGYLGQLRLLEALADDCREFVRKCESGEARSIRSYTAMKEHLAALDKPTVEKENTDAK